MRELIIPLQHPLIVVTLKVTLLHIPLSPLQQDHPFEYIVSNLILRLNKNPAKVTVVALIVSEGTTFPRIVILQASVSIAKGNTILQFVSGHLIQGRTQVWQLPNYSILVNLALL